MNDKLLGQILTARFTVNALLDDYAKVVSKIEKTTEQEIKNRVSKKSEELLKDFQKKISLES